MSKNKGGREIRKPKQDKAPKNEMSSVQDLRVQAATKAKSAK